MAPLHNYRVWWVFQSKSVSPSETRSWHHNCPATTSLLSKRRWITKVLIIIALCITTDATSTELDWHFMKEISVLARQQKNNADIFRKLCVNEITHHFTSSVRCTRESTVESLYSVKMPINSSIYARNTNNYSVCMHAYAGHDHSS